MRSPPHTAGWTRWSLRGIGENAPVVRARICDGFTFPGVEPDEKQNAANAKVVPCKTSAVTVRVMQTDEELMIAKAVIQLVNGGTSL